MEDAILNSYYTNIIWYLSLLSKGYMLGNKSILYILKIINLTINTPWKDKSYRHIKLKNNINYSKLINTVQNVKQQHKNILWSLYFRSSYNGMLCDTDMIYRTIILWCKRLKTDSFYVNYLDAYIFETKKNIELEGLEKSEILKESIDFHCTDICNRISLYTDIETQKIKELIWNFRSSKNTRLEVDIIKNDDLLKRHRDKNLWISLKNIIDIESFNIIREKF